MTFTTAFLMFCDVLYVFKSDWSGAEKLIKVANFTIMAFLRGYQHLIEKISGIASPKYRGGGTKLHRLFQWRTQDSAKGVPQPEVWGAKPPAPRSFRVFTRKILILA